MHYLFLSLFFIAILFNLVNSIEFANTNECSCYKYHFIENRIAGRVLNSAKVKDFKSFPFVGSVYSKANIGNRLSI